MHLVLRKVAIFHNEAYTFLYQEELGANFLTLPIGILHKSAIFS